jgi:hypothetical protein
MRVVAGRSAFGLVSLALMLSAMPRAWAEDADECSAAARGIPPRAVSAPAGSEVARRLAGLSGPERDGAIVAEIEAGNLPEHLRHARPVRLPSPAGVAGRRLTLCVLPDYLAVGTDADFLLVPLGLGAALRLAGDFGFELPTRRVVDAIDRQAAAHVDPRPLPASDAMRSTPYLVLHNAIVQAQRQALGVDLDALAAGFKKDLVLTRRLWEMPGRVAIYGWHRASGTPVQPLSIVHGARYADYSHGVRLVSATAWLDGRPRTIEDLLARDDTAAWLSDEGVIPLRERRAELVSTADPR